MKLTLEEARAKLAQLQAKFDNDPLAKSFYLGRVGYRKQTKKYLRSVDKNIDEAIYMGKLQAHINTLEAAERRRNEPVAERPKKVKEIKPKVLPGTYDIGFYDLGGGISVANSAREVRGDFEKIAFIPYCGEPVQYRKENLPDHVVQQVEEHAAQMKVRYEQKQEDDRQTRQKNKEWLLTQGYTREQITRAYGPF